MSKNSRQFEKQGGEYVVHDVSSMHKNSLNPKQEKPLQVYAMNLTE